MPELPDPGSLSPEADPNRILMIWPCFSYNFAVIIGRGAGKEPRGRGSRRSPGPAPRERPTEGRRKAEGSMYWYLLAKNWFEAKVAEEKGQDLVEYALIIALVSIAIVAGLTALKGGIEGVFSTIVGDFGS